VRYAHAGHRHYVWRNGHRYVYEYGYNPGAAGVVGGVAAGYPYSCDYSYGGCDYGDYADYGDYGDYGGFGFGFGSGFHGRHFDHGFHRNGARFANGNFGHVGGFGGGNPGGFGGGHFGGFGGGHMGGFGGGHFGGGGGGHFR
jgi:hypothetical protein